jgi:ferric-dicitrate binding protein FerR (iron transport regulator)
VNTNFSRYEGFSAEEFARDAYFQQWVIFPLPDDELFWNSFFEHHPHQQENILLARSLVRNGSYTEHFEPLSGEEKLALRQRILDQATPTSAKKLIGKWRSMPFLKIAAVVGGIVLITATFLRQEPSAAYLVVEKAGNGETRRIELADSSVVILNANSTLTYSSDFTIAQTRAVKLEGNAFFNIRKKTDHQPFEVQANSLFVTVLGTSFNVNARKRETEIVLASGKVKLKDHKNSQPVFMEPGDKVGYDQSKGTFTRSTADIRLYQAWNDHKWHFSATSLADITSLIHAYYGVNAVFADPAMKSIKINAVIPVTDLQSFTNVIAKTLDITIIHRNNELILQH